MYRISKNDLWYDDFSLFYLGRTINMQDPTTIAEVENKAPEPKNNGSGKDLNELPQRSASLESSETESTVNMSLFKKARESEESLECSPENNSGKKKKKRRKKKAEMIEAVPDSTEQRLPSLVPNAEETGGNTDSGSQDPSVKEDEEPDPVEDSPANKKNKNMKKKLSCNVSESELKTGDILEKQLDNRDINVTSAPKEEKSGSTVEDQGDIAVMENEKHENDVGTKSQKGCGDSVISGIENDSGNMSKDSLADTTSARKEDENAPASEKGESSISEIVPSEVKPAESAKESCADTGPEEQVESDSSDDLFDAVDNEG